MAGCEPVVVEKAAGKLARRPEPDQALLGTRAGDQLVVIKVDRLGRSRGHLIEPARMLQQRQIDLVVLDQGASDAGGRSGNQRERAKSRRDSNSPDWVHPTPGRTAGAGAGWRGAPRRAYRRTGLAARRPFIRSKNSWWRSSLPADARIATAPRFRPPASWAS